MPNVGKKSQIYDKNYKVSGILIMSLTLYVTKERLLYSTESTRDVSENFKASFLRKVDFCQILTKIRNILTISISVWVAKTFLLLNRKYRGVDL